MRSTRVHVGADRHVVAFAAGMFRVIRFESAAVSGKRSVLSEMASIVAFMVFSIVIVVAKFHARAGATINIHAAVESTGQSESNSRCRGNADSGRGSNHANTRTKSPNGRPKDASRSQGHRHA